ncbi:MAG: TfoX/Sxy family protein [Rhodoferax sp.]|nr:TfoX/Sxy family protein [Rhodoferax sp.]
MAAPRNEFAQYCCDLLNSVGPCVARRMFGGYGISNDGLTLALLVDLGDGEKLWLKADESSRPVFAAAGCARFTYLAKGQAKSMNYYSAPDDAMESAQLMAPWARLALEAALKAQQAKPVSRRAAKPKAPRQAKAGIKAG